MGSSRYGEVDCIVNTWIYYYPGLPKFLSNANVIIVIAM